MEEDKKKKKRNNKKKSKQTKSTEDSTLAVADTASVEDLHVDNRQRDHNHVSGTDAVQSDVMDSSDVNLNGRHLYETKDPVLEETIEKLQKDNNMHIPKESNLEDIVTQLKEQNCSYIQKEADLELKIAQLQKERDSWIQKEAKLEEKISQLLDEQTNLESKRASSMVTIEHLKREKDSCILKENSSRETILGLNDNISKLQAQVVELEESRHNLLQKNKQLMENISDLQSQIHSFEQSISSPGSSDEVIKDLNSQVEAACGLVERLIAENAELVEKLSELYVEIHGRTTETTPTSAVEPEQLVGTVEDTSYGDAACESKLEALESVPIKEEISGSYDEKMELSSEIVEDHLDENQIRGVESEGDGNVAVPLSDAPLVGAPFRLISFVAKYVSGADLVDESSLPPAHSDHH